MRFVMASCVLTAAALGSAAGCTINNTVTPSDGGTQTGDTGSPDSGSTTPLGFVPSNISLGGIDLSMVVDEDIATECDLATDATVTAGGSCFKNAAEAIVAQSDGSKVHVFVVKSLRLESTAHLSVNRPAGGLPLAIVSLGEMTILGRLDVHAVGDQAYGGGYASSENSQKGAGPGGGPAATGVATTTLGAGAGGGSYCGRGGQGALEPSATGTQGVAAAPYGTPEIVPLVGGSSGGSGSFGAGAGGGALQLVAGGRFSMAVGSSINVGGGGGQPAVSSNWGDDSGGGGSGGSILIEASVVQIAGLLAANGGGGGGVSASGHDGTADATPAAGGASAGIGAGGAGSGATVDGTSPAVADPGPEGGGGGGAGRIRINSKTGTADLTGATLSPAQTTSCVTQGKTR